jgi:hypothetical protein
MLQAAIGFRLHFSIIAEDGGLKKGVQSLMADSKEKAIELFKESLKTQKVDLDRLNIFQIDEISSPEGAELGEAQVDEKVIDDPQPATVNESVQEELDEEKNDQEDCKDDQEDFEKGDLHRDFKCRGFVKQCSITNKDGDRILKVTLEVTGYQVPEAQMGLLKFGPSEALRVTFEPVQPVIGQDDKPKGEDEDQKGLPFEMADDETEQPKDETEQPDGETKVEDAEPEPEKVELPKGAISQGFDKSGIEYFFSRGQRRFYSVDENGVVSESEGPGGPLTNTNEKVKS